MSATSRASDVLVLKSSDIKPYQEALEGFKRTCRCTITEFLLRDARGELANKAAEIHARAIFAVGMDALSEAQAITEMPVVYAMVPSHPASARQNISGVSMRIPAEKQLAAMVRILPGAKRIGVVYDPKNSDGLMHDALRAAKEQNLELILSTVQGLGEVPSRIDGMKNRIDFFWMLPDTTVINPETLNHLFFFSFQNKVPIFSFSKKFVEQGAVAALSIDPVDVGAQAGEIMQKQLSKADSWPRLRQDVRKPLLMINRRIAAKMDARLGANVPEGEYDVR
ncbi:MAG: ABC transporter substrate-binding protein [Nitrospirae bacterium]|nr:ABC transporter substrate-binding protein [Nitrospirota bacterium]